jgi:hypothetical protein
MTTRCECRPPAREVRAEYTEATYTWDRSRIGDLWVCVHGTVWRNKRAWGLGGTVWRKLNGRAALRATRRMK